MQGDADRGGALRIPWRIVGWGGAALLLVAPLAAMQFTEEVAWTAFDFALMGVLLAGVGVGLELAVRRAADSAYRIAAGVALAAAFLLVWINGAVGIIGSERQDANLLYLAAVGVALGGAAVARFRPAGVARAMVLAALAQVLAPVAAAVLAPETRALVWSPQALGLTTAFAAMWLVSAWLFRKAATQSTRPY